MSAPTNERQPPARRRSFAARVWGALRLDAAVFEEVEGDPAALAPAALVVLSGGLARGVGAYAQEGVFALIGSPLIGVAVWLSASLMIYGVGVRRFRYTSTYPELVRTLGFAAVPLWLLALCALAPALVATGLWVLLHAWATLALVVAVREALDVPTGTALAVCAIALGITLGVLFVMGFLFHTCAA